MPSNNPAITVLMPAYNAGKYIAEAIASVLQQSFVNFELLIVNDGCTDDTAEVVRSFSDDRIVVIKQPNGGVAAALNTGLKHAKANYVARFDADDICHPKRLETQYQFMLANPEYHIIGSAANYVDKNGVYVFNYQPPGHSNEQLQQLAYANCPFIHSTVFYKKDVVISAGGYNVNALGFEDHLLWRNIGTKGKLFNFSQSLIKVRLNPESVTIDESWCTPRFRELKYHILEKGYITPVEGNELQQISKSQYKPQIKQGAYYVLLAKKFLWNNHQPAKARENLKAVIQVNRFGGTSYALFLLSFLPKGLLLRLYNIIK
ncbi:glycosyl transferase family 2 [Mucilaginibacter gracilis]|uniref:Glycosyl transferase family 2 n=1 Tax=Mucilaginibacter gracilis TaxID=423350 RepID=A0A495J4B4_9SPHI|nr:glycosyltransferase [Mucilaginibacter gracilis]RKR83531.1 glycosyl transferase family 2 [Mucilaginibacter gracilis]